MIDLEDRLHALADAVDVPPVSPHDDLLRGRRRRRRRQWATTGGTALASAAVVVAVWGVVGGPSSEKVGPADRTVPPTQVEEDLRRDLDTRQSELAAMDADRRAYDLLVDRLGLEPAAPYRLSLIPSYDADDRIQMLAPSVVVQDDATGELREVSARIARTWEATEWRDFSCYPGCATYELDGRAVEVGRYADQWGWATERADGTVVVVLLPKPANILGIQQDQVDAVLRDAVLPDSVDEAAAWNDRMLDVGLQYFTDSPYSIITGDASAHTGPTVKAQAAFRGTVEGEVWWQAELLSTAPDGCRPGFECQDRVIDGTPLTFRFIRGGEHDGWAWIEHDGPVVRSRVLMEPSRAEGVAWPIPLERVASFLAHPFWQDLPPSQSVPIG